MVKISCGGEGLSARLVGRKVGEQSRGGSGDWKVVGVSAGGGEGLQGDIKLSGDRRWQNR